MIYEFDDLVSEIGLTKQEGSKIVLCHGTFDGLHIGHIKHFQAAKKFGDVLVVTLTPDRFVNKGPGRPYYNEQLRAEAIDALQCVDCVAITKWVTGIETIKLLQPDYYVKGSDYEKLDDDITGNIRKEKEAVESIGGEIKFTHEITFSASSMLNKQMLPPATIKFLQQFKKKYTVKDVFGYINKIKDLKILIVSEYIKDVYQYGATLGKAGKFPIVAFRNDYLEEYEGGSLVINRHLKDFVNRVDVCTNLSPVIKKRYVEHNQKLFETYTYPEDIHVMHYSYTDIEDYDLVLVADFGHGLITKDMRKLTENKAKFLAVAVQYNAGNMGMSTINKYNKWDYACIDHAEIRMATNGQFDSIEDIIKENFAGRNIMAITMSKDGCIIYKGNKIHKIPPFATKIVDTVGAGDAFLAITAPLAYINAPADIIGFVGNCAGAIACGYPGNKENITKERLYKYIETLMK